MNTKLYKLMNWARIEGVVYSEEDHPHEILGAKAVSGGTLIQAFLPYAEQVSVKLTKDNRLIPMELVDEEGFFAVLIKEKVLFDYVYMVTTKDGENKEVKEVYNFPSTVSERDARRFQAGLNYEAYDMLGSHPREMNGVHGTAFAVWAPNAVRVSVVGDFNHWDGRTHQMRRISQTGIFEIFIPDLGEGELYKYEIKIKGSLIILKADPYAFGAQLRPESASVIRDISQYYWRDDRWMQKRRSNRTNDQPISVYEVHLGSFQKPTDGREFYNYRELAVMLTDYVKEMEYTHVELMPVMEHPLDESWGYQVTGYYAPTSRYGTPEDFMFFMNYLHEHEIGVILDWVPAHFPRDSYGLSNFDGTCLYEHQDPRQGVHPQWGTLIYQFGRPEVSNFLIASALFWINKYHADGIRVDAVASMLYLDYGKQDGEWIANIYGGNENLEAIELIKHLNSVVKKQHEDVLLIAEESTAWPMVTGALKDGGLGFDYKWNMGWMNDFLGYMRYDPYYRTHHFSELTFSMIYAYSENFMLPFSHDEVVHGKSSLIGKMPGEREQKFSNLRASLAYMMMHPGKKLIFMGQDLGEFDEWNEKREVEWELLDYEEHQGVHQLVKALNHFYRMHPALFKLDHSMEGFEWINNISANENIIVFLRKSRTEDETLLIVCNFGGNRQDQYKIGVPGPGKYKEVFNTDAVLFGGSGMVNPRLKQSKRDECDDREDSIRIRLAPLSVSVFQYTRVNEELKDNQAAKEKAIKNGKKVARKKSGLKKELELKYQREERGASL